MFGTPLGAGKGQRGPTVALVTDVEAVTVDNDGPELVVELWEVADDHEHDPSR